MSDFNVVSDEEFAVIERLRKEKQHEEYKYLHLLQRILDEGVRCPNRTGIDAITLPHAALSFDMANGFPLFTHKKMATKTFKVELEGFIKGITDKKWYQDRGCHIWDEWCNPQKVKYGHDTETKKKMLEETDLGRIYGAQWRSFGKFELPLSEIREKDNQIIQETTNIKFNGVDQLKWIIDELKTNPINRQLVCSAWSPVDKPQQALPPCHVLWHVFTTENKLHMCWFQRSCDFPLGIPANIMSYALLLHLLCKETGLVPGKVSGFLSNCHIYVNQIDGVKEALSRPVFKFPKVRTDKFTSIFDWEANDTVFDDYRCGEKISFPIAV